ncbi:GT-D fold domain-containing glycosyltransferase [Alkalihalobacterium alkalinitrilicum]|uniref:GT-D fold domain-containing protein n=1 Tax=Alkalihalobacterium alkalinitrilicum TaxID=427920 RepID=UPI001152D3EA|nr:GT-D fold domain-containing glycosyltransferase [Alkalihalobacterium alkalinitrilicum]
MKCRCHDYTNQIINLEKILDSIEISLKNKSGLSLVRFGHGEISYLSWPFNRELVQHFHYWSQYAGFREPPKKIYPKLLEALRQTDIAGLPPEDDWDNPIWDDRMCKVLHYFNISPKKVCSSWLPQELIPVERFWEILRGYKISIVGRRAKEGVKAFNKQGVEVTNTISLEPGEEKKVHSYLCSKNNWDITLVSAGFPGKLVTPKLSKSSKRIVIDFGHALDQLIEGDEVDWKLIISIWKKDNLK